MHPIIFLWAHPRSMSTAIERIMRERGDLNCLHEPFLHYYYAKNTNKSLAYFDPDNAYPDSYQQTRELILKQAKTGPVFAKDMSYYLLDDLLADSAFFKRITHCFLIRDQRRAIASYYKLDPGISLEEIGLESQWQHFQAAQQAGLNPLVVEAEAIQADPQGIIGQLWSALGLDFQGQAFSWNQGSTPADWQYVKGWHQQASQSVGIQTETPEQQQLAVAEFEKAVNEAPFLQDYLHHHLPAYRQLKQRSISATASDPDTTPDSDLDEEEM